MGKADAVVSPLKMNVLYIGVDNPLSISASGVPSADISATMTNGTLNRSGNDWVARPQSVGEAVVTVSGKVDGQNKVMGTMKFRVKQVPNPVAKVGGQSRGRMDKGTLAAQVAVVAVLENFDFDMKFRVTEFTVSAVGKGGFTNSKPTKGANITADQKALINSATKGSKITFDEIKATGPDGSVRELNPITLTVQ